MSVTIHKLCVLVVSKAHAGLKQLTGLDQGFVSWCNRVNCVTLTSMCALRLVSRTVKRVHVHSVTVAIAKLTTLWQDEKGYIVVDDDDDDAVCSCLSYDVCLEVRGEIIRTVLCCIVY